MNRYKRWAVYVGLPAFAGLLIFSLLDMAGWAILCGLIATPGVFIAQRESERSYWHKRFQKEAVSQKG